MTAEAQRRGVAYPAAMGAMKLDDLSVKLFTDGADKAQILDMAAKPWIKGFTTNPSLLKKAGVADYAAYGRELVEANGGEVMLVALAPGHSSTRLVDQSRRREHG